MFDYRTPQVDPNMQDLHDALQSTFLEVCEGISGSSSSNILTETDNINMITSKLLSKLNTVIYKYISRFKTKNSELEKYITAKHRYLTTLILQNDSKLTNIPQDTMLNIRYEKIYYIIPTNIPGIVNTDALSNANTIFSQGKITKDILEKLQDKLKIDLSNSISAMLNTKHIVQLYDIDMYYRDMFKRVISVVDVPISNVTVSSLIKSINSYPNDIATLNVSLTNMIKLFTSYTNIIGTMFMYDYIQNGDEINIRLGNRIVQKIPLYELGYHNSYRTTVFNHIITILNLYLSLYEEKISLIKEKIEYEEELLLKIIKNIK